MPSFRILRCNFCLALFLPLISADTVVRFKTVLGDFDVQLYDTAGPVRGTPLTVANFLAYTLEGSYNNSFFHRSMPGFVLQSGGFGYDPGANSIYAVTTKPAVANEPGNSNVRGTIAMAKNDGLPDSATSQWFINLADNSTNLDAQNGGFTVFGHVLGDGMDVVDALAAVTVYNATGFHPAFTNLPLLNPSLSGANLLLIQSVTVVPLRVKGISFDTGSGGATLTWEGAGDAPVNVYRSTNLVSTDWDLVAANVTTGEFTDPAPPDTVYYKILIP